MTCSLCTVPSSQNMKRTFFHGRHGHTAGPLRMPFRLLSGEGKRVPAGRSRGTAPSESSVGNVALRASVLTTGPAVGLWRARPLGRRRGQARSRGVHGSRLRREWAFCLSIVTAKVERRRWLRGLAWCEGPSNRRCLCFGKVFRRRLESSILPARRVKTDRKLLTVVPYTFTSAPLFGNLT